MKKKEFYKHRLPHFQQPGQAYFITWCLNAAVPPKALERYTKELELLKHQISVLGAVKGVASGAAISNRREEKTRLEIASLNSRLQIATPIQIATPDKIAIENRITLEKLKKAYYLARKKYIKAYDDLLDAAQNLTIDLSKPVNREILVQTLLFWEGRKIKNIAFTIMPNHVHWVLELRDRDEHGNLVFLQDIMQSVKRQSARLINKAENRLGTLWQKESFDTTIRDERHLYYATRYTLNNPVKAGLVRNWDEWKGTWCRTGYGDF